jgi:tetratricopeptide (TPR) repeat protein
MKTLLLIAVAAVVSPRLNASSWIHMASANFEIYTSSNEREARQTLQTFGQVRDFFMRMKSSGLTTRLPVTIVGFRNPGEYKPYRMSESAAAYFVGDEQRDYIVMSDLGLEHTPVAIHEYMHLLIRHSGLKAPLWLNEGLAELYSTLKPFGGEILLGSVPRGRAYELQASNWLPLPTLFAATHSSREYTSKEHAGIFYAQSWLIAHMLFLGDGYRNEFGEFLLDVSASESTAASLAKVYGKSVEEVSRDAARYYQSSTLRGVRFKTRFQKMETGQSRPATELESGLVLAKLLWFTGHKQEAMSEMERLATAHKGSYELEEALGYREWQEGNIDGAVRRLGAAVDRGARAWKTHWDYARLLAGSGKEPERFLAAVRRAVELNPELVDAHIMLGQELFRRGRPAEALIALRKIKTLDPERASPVLGLMAYCGAGKAERGGAAVCGAVAQVCAQPGGAGARGAIAAVHRAGG